MTRKIKRYSVAFRRQVVFEYEAGCSIPDLQRKYGITGNETIPAWIKKYSREGFRHELVRVQMADEIDRIKKLEQKVHELEQALSKVMLEKIGLESVVEELLGTREDIIKKNEPPLSNDRSTKPANNSAQE
jgi:transposase-like protein